MLFAQPPGAGQSVTVGSALLLVLSGLSFARTMKAEGVTRASLGGKAPLVYVDDAGGFLVVWNDAANLR